MEILRKDVWHEITNFEETARGWPTYEIFLHISVECKHDPKLIDTLL